MMVVMALLPLLSVLMFAAWFRVNVRRNDHFAIIAHHFTDPCPIIWIIDRVFTRHCRVVMMMVTVALAAPFLFWWVAKIIPGLSVRLTQSTSCTAFYTWRVQSCRCRTVTAPSTASVPFIVTNAKITIKISTQSALVVLILKLFNYSILIWFRPKKVIQSKVIEVTSKRGMREGKCSGNTNLYSPTPARNTKPEMNKRA